VQWGVGVEKLCDEKDLFVEYGYTSSKHVFYCRTHNPSSYALQSTLTQTTHFDVPLTIEFGPGTLVVVTNGIPSAPVQVSVN
jgi:hypothetical protein